MAAEVKPAEDKLPHDAYELPADVLEGCENKAREIGLWCVRSPVEYGGAGLSLLGQAVVAEEAAKCRMGAYVPACGAFGADPPNAIWLGTKDQIERYGVPESSRARRSTSRSAGLPVAPTRPSIPRARRAQGATSTLNGSKMWITGAKGADWGIVFARTGRAGRPRRHHGFHREGQSEGMSLKPIGDRSYAPYEITFKDVEVPVEDRLGEEGQGLRDLREVAHRGPHSLRRRHDRRGAGRAADRDRVGQGARDLPLQRRTSRPSSGWLPTARWNCAPRGC
jgi:acyl-CoA dehydrogenase